MNGRSAYRLTFAVAGCWNNNVGNVSFKLIDGQRLIATKIVSLVLPPAPEAPWHQTCKLSKAKSVGRNGGRTNNGVAHYVSATVYGGQPAVNGVAFTLPDDPFDSCIAGVLATHPSRHRGSVTQSGTVRLTKGPSDVNESSTLGPVTCNLSYGTCNVLKTTESIPYVGINFLSSLVVTPYKFSISGSHAVTSGATTIILGTYTIISSKE